MLRIKDPKVTVPYYEKNFGFTLIHKYVETFSIAASRILLIFKIDIYRYDFPQWNFSLYFLATLPEGEVGPVPGTKEAEKYLWSMKGTCLELTHNHGSEDDANFLVMLSCFA